MYCIKCGTNNSDAANYCRKCGELMEAEEETRVAVRPGAVPVLTASVNPAGLAQVPARPPMAEGAKDGLGKYDPEEHIFSIGPTLLFVKLGYVLAAFGALLLVAIMGVLSGVFTIPSGIAVILGLMLFLIPAFFHIKAKLVRYSLTGSQIEIDSGLISRTTRNVPLRRIQDVTVATSAAQRLLGFGDLVIDNASEEGGKVILKNINAPKRYADMMLKEMRRLDG
jgi:membrane protein YdbS with pleckstrin-like domain